MNTDPDEERQWRGYPQTPEVVQEQRFNALRGALGKLQDTVDGTNKRIDIQNGRVAGLETWRGEREKQEQRDREVEQYETGIADGRTAALAETLAKQRNRDRAIVAAAIAAASLVSPFVIFLLGRFL